MAVKVWVYIMYICGSLETSIIILRKDDKTLGLPLWGFLTDEVVLYNNKKKKYRAQPRTGVPFSIVAITSDISVNRLTHSHYICFKSAISVG